MKIAAVKTGAIGDLIQITPALSALRKKYPESEIILVCAEEYAHVLKNHPAISGTTCFSAKRLYSPMMPFEAIRIHSILRKFDKAYVFHADLRWHWLAMLSGAKYSCSEKDCTPRHMWHLRTVGMGFDFGYSFQPDKSTTLLPDKPYVAIAAGGGRNIRRYTPQKIWDKQTGLALMIAQETPFSVALLGTAEEKLNVSHPKILDFTGKTTLSDCFRIIAGAERYIGCDSGLTHLAACTDTPITAIFGATDPRECSPPSVEDIIMSKRRCAPCEKNGTHTCKENLCMREINVEDVIKTFMKD
jgi:ADP-heptose:LPS heptosyltransferase